MAACALFLYDIMGLLTLTRRNRSINFFARVLGTRRSTSYIHVRKGVQICGSSWLVNYQYIVYWVQLLELPFYTFYAGKGVTRLAQISGGIVRQDVTSVNADSNQLNALDGIHLFPSLIEVHFQVVLKNRLNDICTWHFSCLLRTTDWCEWTHWVA